MIFLQKMPVGLQIPSLSALYMALFAEAPLIYLIWQLADKCFILFNKKVH